MASEAGPRMVQTGNATLAPPASNELSMRRPMERTPSMAIKAEKEDLKEAAEDSFNVILDLNLDGNVRWVSPSWEDVIGTTCESVQGRPIADILLDDKDVFKNAVETMQNDDSRSFKVRFSVLVGPKSKLARDPAAAAALESEEEAFPMEGVREEEDVLTLEGQGILIYDKTSGEASHTMWVIRPFVEPNEITIDLPPVLVESLGVGAGMLARYLTSLAEQGAVDPANNPPPMPVLCRICERQIQPWWFEKHSELCMLEHKAESDVQLCQENLSMHRHAIVKILDAMERRSSRPVSGEISVAPSPIEYRGLPIGPSPSTPSSGTASPGTPPSRPRDSSAGGLGRSRSFPARRPLVRIVELLLDLCDTAMEISTPAIKESYGAVELGTFRTQSPQSEARINQVLQWSSPTTNTLDEEKGLALLCQDSEAVAKAKVDAVFRHRNTIEYSERIRLEFSMLVQDCIDEALRKASELASDVPDEEYSDGSDIGDDTPFFAASFGPALQRSSSSLGPPRGRLRRHSSPAESGPTSPMECSTPKSQQSLKRVNSRRQKAGHRASMHFENEGADSDTSGRSSLAAAMGHPQTESPVSDHELTASRVYAAGDKRRQNHPSMTSGNSPRRQESPARIAPSSSPLRIQKPRSSVLCDGTPTPMTSPLLSTGDFSPALDAFHHKRQSSVTSSDQFGKPPVSPRLSGVNPTQQNRAVPPSIKDFEIIKPISKGAFGSVYLSKKKSTGDYFAIKVLKKADMIAKNQVTNVRAERAIMMVQGESDFVAKLFWTFASKDYLYLVMEYLNGGDCAALIKVLSGLPEDWAQKYLAEVVLGVEHLHSRGIVHRDLKPDNLLIDQKGHLKLTDFGLSRMGLLGRQKRAQTQSSESTPDLLKQGPFARSRSVASSSGQDEMSDWWSLGCILFEFLYGYPPFHADAHDKVFENILDRRIDWPDPEDDDVSDEAKHLMNRLMCTDPNLRLGANGAEEVKKHPWFANLNWETLLEEQPSFVPTPQDPEDTEYFDSRGATLQSFVEEFEDQSASPQVLTPGADLPERPHDAVSRTRREVNSNKRGLMPLSIPPHVREGRNRRLSEPNAQDDFGSFAFKNLPVLEKANKDVIQKLRTEALKSAPALATSNPSSPSAEGSPILSSKSLSRTLSNPSKNGGKRPVSPSNLHHTNSSPARTSQPSSPLLMSFTATGLSERRKASNASASSGFSQNSGNPPSMGQQPGMAAQLGPFVDIPRNTGPQPSPSKNPLHRRSANPRVRSLTVGSTDSEPGYLEGFRHQKRRSQVFDMSPSSSDNEDVKSSALLRVQRRRQSSRRMSNISLTEGSPMFRPLDVLVCEDHPVSKLVMERLLEKLRCRTICVDNGAEAMRYAMGEVKFDIILMEFKLPQINGEDVARMIRSSRNPNSNTPIVAVTGYLKDLSDPHHFTELIEKPATSVKLTDVLERNCNWKPPNTEQPMLADRKESLSIKKPSGAMEESGRMSPSVEKFMSSQEAGPRLSEQFSSMDEDEAASMARGAEPIMISRSTTNEWEKLYIRKSSTPRSSTSPSTTSSNAPQATGSAHHETAPSRLHSSSIERIPSQLSTYTSAGMLDNIPPPLPSPPEMTPLPPSIASTPIFSTPAADRSRSPLSIASVPTQSKTPPPPMERLKNMLPKRLSPPRRTRSPPEEPTKESPPKNFSRINPPSPTKTKEPLGPSMMNSSPSSPESKTRAKRTSWEKKKEKQEKQQNQHLRPEDADADDELPVAGGKRPSKSKSISEIISRARRGAAHEMKRSKSDKGESSEGNGELGGALGDPPKTNL
ncbi:hypothetical protein C7212DRAFT_190564 [Tuber magnatum]|uniref:non-specific serine/threonine protein kinase n=1 Tax=Tuber magnatum TaxID=42249 RepID=A0A317SR16_9PEZI|nr:hypothetical protein C7212DRAFT_190564 [Tuber magnatum]